MENKLHRSFSVWTRGVGGDGKDFGHISWAALHRVDCPPVFTLAGGDFPGFWAENGVLGEICAPRRAGGAHFKAT